MLYVGTVLPLLALTECFHGRCKERHNNTKLNQPLQIFKPTSRN